MRSPILPSSWWDHLYCQVVDEITYIATYIAKPVDEITYQVVDEVTYCQAVDEITYIAK